MLDRHAPRKHDGAIRHYTYITRVPRRAFALCNIHTSMAIRESVKRALWGAPSAERSLVIKLDFTLLPYFALIWFLFGVNQASYGSAYISGMGDDLHFQGKDFNYMNTIYLVTYAVFQIPATTTLTLLRPKWVFVSCNIVWSVLTLVTYRTSHVYQVFVIFGFEGAFAAVC